MKKIRGIELHESTREEILPDFSQEFPCITTWADLDRYASRVVPWHWHNALEFFYVESGALDYYTAGGVVHMPTGSGGFVNSGVLHMTTHKRSDAPNVQLIHLFEPSFLAQPGSRIDMKYIQPIITNTAFEILSVFPDKPSDIRFLEMLHSSFDLRTDELGYELKLRERIGTIWLEFFQRAIPQMKNDGTKAYTSLRIKQMMTYVHEHYHESISVKELADAAICSQRECYRMFQSCLRMTPREYLQSYRLQMACQMLTSGTASIGDVGSACGFVNNSYFGKVFRKEIGCTPMEYRRRYLRQREESE